MECMCKPTVSLISINKMLLLVSLSCFGTNTINAYYSKVQVVKHDVYNIKQRIKPPTWTEWLALKSITHRKPSTSLATSSFLVAKCGSIFIMACLESYQF